MVSIERRRIRSSVSGAGRESGMSDISFFLLRLRQFPKKVGYVVFSPNSREIITKVRKTPNFPQIFFLPIWCYDEIRVAGRVLFVT